MCSRRLHQSLPDELQHGALLHVLLAGPARDHVHQPSRRADAPSGPRVECTVSNGERASKRFKGKGALHANRCAGPWASALDPERMPQLPPTGAKRARAGLSEVPSTRAEEKLIKTERAARALVALLPFGAAPFILKDTTEGVRARAPEDTAERALLYIERAATNSTRFYTNAFL